MGVSLPILGVPGVMGSRIRDGVKVLLKANFNGPNIAAADMPTTLSTPYVSVGGPLTLVEDSDKLSIVSNQLFCASGAPATLAVQWPNFTFQTGLAWFLRTAGGGWWNAPRLQIGLTIVTSEQGIDGCGFMQLPGLVSWPSTQTGVWMIHQADRCLILNGNSVLNFASKITYTQSAASLYRPGPDRYTTYMGAALLPAPFNTEWALVTQRLAGARAANDTFTHTANALIEFTMTTRPSSGSIDLRFCQQDATNYWQVTIDSAGALTLNEVVAGTPTSRATKTGVSNGAHVEIIADGTLIGVAVNGSGSESCYYNAAVNFRSSTSGVLSSLGTGGAVSDLITWPRALPAAAQAVLEAVNFT